ncbi:MAG: nitroreductase [Chitinivibrionales bacterium]|nr:nitroreductase [Chitinivibrionales bacterium]MBD3397312.1 nitroreductase [Chitinivibrionales bacterium]
MFLELAQRRCSVRSYSDRPVEYAKLTAVLEAGRAAPSAVNYQPCSFVVLRGEEVGRLRASYAREWFLKAPVAIAVCCDRERSWKRSDGKDYGDVDAAIAMDHMILAATELGLGTCWIGAFNAEKAATALNLPPHMDAVVLTPLGYPSGEAELKPRRPLNELVRWGAFGAKE